MNMIELKHEERYFENEYLAPLLLKIKKDVELGRISDWPDNWPISGQLLGLTGNPVWPYIKIGESNIISLIRPVHRLSVKCD